jgi:hypothetical protein
MSYSANKGKYQKAYDFLYKKLVPPSGRAKNALGEALRLVSRVYYRRENDGDSYGDCIEDGIVPDFAKKQYPFDKEYEPLGKELDHILSTGNYDEAVNLVLFNIMLSLSSTTHIYNPASNRLVEIDTPAGKKALDALDINTVFINYCGKNKDWLPEQLRKDGVKITKLLSPETRKELSCETIEELHRVTKGAYGSKKTMKVRLPHDNSILSKKFRTIESQHKKSVKEAERKMKQRQKQYEQEKKRKQIHRGKHLTELKKFYETLKDMTTSVRVDTVKKMKKSKMEMNEVVRMALFVLDEYKEKKPTTKAQKEHRSHVISTLVSQLNTVGKEVFAELNKPETILYSFYTNPNEDTRKRLDETIVKILGSEEAVDELWRGCCRR